MEIRFRLFLMLAVAVLWTVSFDGWGATKEGTAPKAALEHYVVAGKTGTAQKVVDRGYAAGKFTTSFIGFFPADEPELCISVVLDEPRNGHYGGLIAAPVFKAIAEQAASYMKMRPDREDPASESSAAGRERAGGFAHAE